MKQIFVIEHLYKAVNGAYEKGNDNTVKSRSYACKQSEQQKQLYIRRSYDLQGKNRNEPYEKHQ